MSTSDAASAQTPVVSVVIPCYNGADVIGDALASLRAQTFSAWEAVIVDDGSEDESVSIAEAAAAEDARIRVVSQENAGPSVARNRGLALARGRYVHCLDVDDWVDASFMAQAVARLEEPDAPGVVFFDQVFARAPGEVARERKPVGRSARLFPLLCRGNPFPPGCLVVRRELYERAGEFDPSVPGCEDWDMWLRMARLGAEFVRVAHAGFFYRFRRGSFSGNARMMWASGATVIERAFGSDPRVKDADPEFAAGGPADAKSGVLLSHTLACCVLALAGGDAATAGSLFEDVAEDVAAVRAPDNMARVLERSLWDALALDRGDWNALWEAAGVALLEFLAHIERRLGVPGYAGACLEGLMGIRQLRDVEASTAYKLGRIITHLKPR